MMSQSEKVTVMKLVKMVMMTKSIQQQEREKLVVHSMELHLFEREQMSVKETLKKELDLMMLMMMMMMEETTENHMVR